MSLSFLKDKMFWIGLALIVGGILGLFNPTFIKWIFGIAIAAGVFTVAFIVFIKPMLPFEIPSND
jgi:hypothetical protein